MEPLKPSMRERFDAMKAARDVAVLEAAIKLAADDNYQFITRKDVAKLAGVSRGSVNNAFGCMLDLKRAVIREGIRREILPIIAHAIANGSPLAADIPGDLRDRAIAHLR